MHKTVAKFVNDWTRESDLSLKVERALTDTSLAQKTDPEGRSLGDIAWHMVIMIGMTAAAAGLTIEAPPRGMPVPSAAAAIADAYEKAKESLQQQAAAVLMRAAGLVVPSVCRPSREESAGMRARQGR